MTAPYTQDWESYSKLNPELEAILLSGAAPKLDFPPNITPKDIRRATPPTPPWPGVSEKDIQIPVRDGTSNRARVYQPSEPVDNGPLMVMAFGGGFVIGSLESSEPECRNWVKKFGGVAISVSYRQVIETDLHRAGTKQDRLCPETPFPTGILDVHDAVKWIASNYHSFHADPKKGFVLAGTSSGATAVCATSHLYRDEAISPPLTGVYLSIPGLCLVDALPLKYRIKEKAWEQNKDAPIFNRATSNWLASFVNADTTDPLRSPLIWPTGHKDLPPHYFDIAGGDLWRDVGLIYEEILREENDLKTKVDIFPGLPHGFWAMCPNAEFTKVHERTSEEGFRWLLEQGKQ